MSNYSVVVIHSNDQITQMDNFLLSGKIKFLKVTVSKILSAF